MAVPIISDQQADIPVYIPEHRLNHDPVPTPTQAPLPEPFDWAALRRTAAKWAKLFICICLDLFDFTFGRLLGFGIGVEIGSACICMALWGWRSGIWAFWELIDMTEQFDGFIPTCTIIAIRSWNNDTP